MTRLFIASICKYFYTLIFIEVKPVITFRRLLKYFIVYWKHIAFAVCCTFLYALLHGASVYLTKPLLDTLFQQDANISKTINTEKVTAESSGMIPKWINDISDTISDTFHSFIFSGDVSEVLFKICVLIFIVFFGKNIFSYFQEYFLAYVEQGIIKDIRNDLYKHLHKLPMSFFKNEKTGDLISRITSDVTVIQSSVSAVFLSMFKEPVTLIVFIVIAFAISWQLTLFSFIILPVSISIIAYIGLKLRKQSKKLQRNLGSITSILNETINGVKIVKAFGMEPYENEKFSRQTNQYFKRILKKVRLRNMASPSTEVIAVIVGAVVIYYGGRLVLIDHTLQASEFLVFLFVIFQMMPPLKQMSSINNKIQEAIASGERIFEILDTEPSIVNAPNAGLVSEFKETIEFRNVGFHYEDSDETILADICFTVKKGQIIALVGSSGAGKTTLVDLIPRFYDPTSGTILLDVKDIKSLKIEDLRKLLGIVTQETVLFNESVRNNIAYGLTGCPMENIIEVAKAANAHNFIMELPNKYDTLIGERGTKLSGGQRQRISIARALLKNPPIMIFDEATSSLDNESELLVQEAIERLMKKRTTFVIAHRLSTIRNADVIFVLDKGRIVQRGKHDELLTDEFGIYKKLYELQFKDV